MSNPFWDTCDTSWKLQKISKSRAIPLKILNKFRRKYLGAQLHMLFNIPVKFHDSMSKPFWVTCDTSWKLQNFTKSRAINLKILNKSRRKYPGAQVHMLINIHVKFHDSRSNTFWVTCDTSWKLQNFTKSWAITLTILQLSRRKYPGVQLHMLINIPVKFHDSRSNTFWVTCDTSWKLQNFTKSRAITLKNTKKTNFQDIWIKTVATRVLTRFLYF
jgi:hypothetical protein